MICIYQIRNKVNGRLYIGSTTNFDCRSKEHWYGLINKNHPNKKIFFDLEKFDHSDFEITPISIFENIDTLWLRYLEGTWIDFLKYHWDLYNINLNTTGWGMQSHTFNSRKEKLEYRKVAKIEKNKANEYVMSKLNSMEEIVDEQSSSPF